ncbi:GNAT family N-acetyltransferase [Bacillus sp. SCS-153A]|uniref:GNAT family N-acetyltransferase n=1 Tax=Rossellomorea sedimentorum TaxID=3115294 RepID=UPI00390665DD
MNFKIREACLRDFDRLKPLHKEVHDLHVAGRPDKYKATEETLDWNYFNELIESPDGKILLIEDGESIVGFTILKKVQPPKWETKVQSSVVFMEDLGVAPSYQRKGLARMLFEKALEFTKDCHADSLELGVWEFNQTAIEFYEQMGMTTQARKMEIKVN